MSARPRDLLKSRAGRLGEVLRHIGLGTGAADGQAVLWGNALAVNGGSAVALDVAAGEAAMAGAIRTFVAAAAQAIPAGATTPAGSFRKVAVERAIDGTVSFVPGVAVTTAQADAVLPQPTPANIVVGWIEVPGLFTAGTTNLQAGWLKPMPYTG